MNRHILILLIAALTLCAGCAGTLAKPSTSPDVINTPPLTTLSDSVHALLGGSTSLPEFKRDDLTNARVIFQHQFELTQNPMDKVGFDCMDRLLAHLPELNELTAPPAPPTLGAEVVGVFSGFAAATVTAETAKARLAAKEKLLLRGIPVDVHIACSPLELRLRQ